MTQLTIDKAIDSPTVRQIAERFHFRRDEMWHVFFDTGVEYLETLKQRVKRKKDFDQQFQPLMNLYGGLTAKEVFRRILASEHFWIWWGAKLWSVCRYGGSVSNKDELYFRLIIEADFIPLFVLNKIFKTKEDEQEKLQQATITT